jgi:hypothetical protein
MVPSGIARSFLKQFSLYRSTTKTGLHCGGKVNRADLQAVSRG